MFPHDPATPYRTLHVPPGANTRSVPRIRRAAVNMAIDPERQKSIAEALTASSLDAFVSVTPSTVLLLTGCWPVIGNTVAIATRSGDTVLVVPQDEVDIAEASTAVRLVPYKPAELDSMTEAADQLRAPLVNLLSALNLASATIGIEVGHSIQTTGYISAAQYRHQLFEVLKAAAPGATFAGCDNVLAALGARKTSIELERISLACRIAASGYARGQSAIQPGATEREVASAFQAAFDVAPLPGTLQRSYGTFFCMSGPNAATASAAYARTRQRIIEDGDLVMVHANTCADGYWTDITRTYTAGQPPERHTEMLTAITAAREAALQAIKPGAQASAVDRAARDVMQARGFGEAFRHCLGHGVGFAAISASALPRIHPASPDILEQGMTFNVEPAAYLDGYGGMRHCDVVAVTKTGSTRTHRLLAHAPPR